MKLYVIARTESGDLCTAQVKTFQSAVDIAKKHPKAEIYESDGERAHLIWKDGKDVVSKKDREGWAAKSKTAQQTLF